MKNYLEFFEESYQRAVASPGQRDDFLDAFYENFIGKSDEIAAKFARTDMVRQKQMLHKSIRHMMEFSITRQASDQLRRIARRHSRSDIDVKPALYDVWLESLVETVQMFDLEFNEEIDLAWRVVLSPGIAYMKYKYDKF